MAKVKPPPPDYMTQCEIARQSTKNFVRMLKKCRDQYEKVWRENLRTLKFLEESNKNRCSNCSVNKKQEEQHENKQPEINENINNEPNNQNVASTSKCPQENVSSDQSVTEIVVQSTPSKTKKTAENKENGLEVLSEEVPEVLKSPIVSVSRRKRKKVADQGDANISANSNKMTSSFHDIFDDAAFEEAMFKAVPDSDQSKTNADDDNDDDRAISPTQMNDKKSRVSRKLTLATSRGLATAEVTPDGRKMKQTKLVALQSPKNKTNDLFDGEFIEFFKEDWKEGFGEKKVNQNSTPSVQGAIIEPTTSGKAVSKEPNSSTMTPKKQKLENCVPESPVSTPLRSFPVCSTSVTKEKEKTATEMLDAPTYFENDTTFFAREETFQNVKVAEKKGKQKEELNFGPTQDETFFTLAEIQEKKNQQKAGGSKQLPTQVWKMIKNYDEIPEKKRTSPERPYKGKTVRNKRERQKLEGWDCWECKKFYEGLDYTEEELRQHKKKCSRHKSKYAEVYNTPPGFWNPVFTNTVGAGSGEDSSCT